VNRLSVVWLIRLGTALLAAGLISGGLAATAGAAKPTRIRMEVTKKDLVFKGPSTIERGTDLQVINETNPKKVGPHTFSIIKRKFLPETNKQYKNCFATGICGPIALAHEFDDVTGKIGRRTVEVGKTGWDKPFSEKHTGDSWYTEGKNNRQTRKISAEPGTKLFYFCAVHPWMQGKITVVK